MQKQVFYCINKDKISKLDIYLGQILKSIVRTQRQKISSRFINIPFAAAGFKFLSAFIMKKRLPYLIIILLLQSCYPKTIPAYYLSPYDINAGEYQAVPLKSDSIKSALYSNFSVAAGGSNDQWRDNVYLFRGSLHRSNNFGHFNAYYGTGLSLGSYNLSDYDRILYSGYRGFNADTILQLPKKNYFTGAYGLNAGIHYVLPYKRSKGEFRIGLETSLQREFGSYLQFRKSLPDSAIDILATDRLTKQLGLSLETIKRTSKGTAVGYKMSFGWSFPSANQYLGDSSSLTPIYFNNILSISKGRITGFCQFNLGVHAGSFQTGMQYMIGRRPIKPK